MTSSSALLQRVRMQHSENDEEIKGCGFKIQELCGLLLKIGAEKSDAVEESNKYKGQVDLLKEQLAERTKGRDKARADKAALEQELTATKRRAEGRKERLRECSDAKRKAEAELGQSKADAARLRGVIEKMDTEMAAEQALLKKEQGKASALAAELGRAKSLASDIEDDVAELRAQVKKLQSVLAEKEKEARADREKIRAMEAELDGLYQRIKGLESDNVTLQAKIDTLKARVASLESDKAALETRVDNLAGDKLTCASYKAALESDKVTLEAEKAALEGDKLAFASYKDALESDKVTLEAEKVALESEKVALESENVTLAENNAALNTKVVVIESEKVALADNNARQKRNFEAFCAPQPKTLNCQHTNAKNDLRLRYGELDSPGSFEHAGVCVVIRHVAKTAGAGGLVIGTAYEFTADELYNKTVFYTKFPGSAMSGTYRKYVARLATQEWLQNFIDYKGPAQAAHPAKKRSVDAAKGSRGRDRVYKLTKLSEDEVRFDQTDDGLSSTYRRTGGKWACE